MKKDHTDLQRKGGEAVWSGQDLHPLVEGTEGEGDGTGLGVFPGGVRDLSHVLGNLAHGSNTGKTTP